MFDNPGYNTIGIQQKLSIELQIILWTLIDSRKAENAELDYLQVFELNPFTALAP